MKQCFWTVAVFLDKGFVGKLPVTNGVRHHLIVIRKAFLMNMPKVDTLRFFLLLSMPILAGSFFINAIIIIWSIFKTRRRNYSREKWSYIWRGIHEHTSSKILDSLWVLIYFTFSHRQQSVACGGHGKVTFHPYKVVTNWWCSYLTVDHLDLKSCSLHGLFTFLSPRPIH